MRGCLFRARRRRRGALRPHERVAGAADAITRRAGRGEGPLAARRPRRGRGERRCRAEPYRGRAARLGVRPQRRLSRARLRAGCLALGNERDPTAPGRVRGRGRLLGSR